MLRIHALAMFALLLSACSGETGVPDGSSPLDSGGGSDGGTADGGGLDECPPVDVCDAPLPELGPTDSWRHTVSTNITVSLGDPRHRGRDLYLRETDDQWAIGKFAYGPTDDDLSDEDVDIYVLRGCAGPWELLGTAATTDDDNPPLPTVEGVEDTGGRVYFEITGADRLALGRHHLLFVVRGDHSIAHAYVEVLPDDARFVVTDVDGTQTESENAAFTALFSGTDPANRPSGPELMFAFARRGRHVLYLTARPEWLYTTTHEWLDAHGYPPGIVHTMTNITGAMGTAAQDFKTAEMQALLARFPGAIDVGIGNTDTDMAAYSTVGLAPDQVIAYQLDPMGLGTRVDDYATWIPLAEMLPLNCR